jgi:tRNA pseudouridine38-40 synthase
MRRGRNRGRDGRGNPLFHEFGRLPKDTPRHLLRFGYDGAAFHGWARQPARRTVEGEVRRGLGRLRLAGPPSYGRLEAASRTDRGVSARGNALAVTTPLSAAASLRSLNGIDPAIWFTAVRTIPEEYRVRGAVRRTYRYYEPPDDRAHGASEAAAALFSGQVDVRSLGRGLPPGAPVRRAIESVTITRAPDGGRTIEVRAPSFVWGEVRKIIGALREVDAGRLSHARLRSALAGEVRLTLPTVAPEPLVLWDVEYSEPWTHVWAGPNRRQRAYLASERERWWSRSQWLGRFGP